MPSKKMPVGQRPSYQTIAATLVVALGALLVSGVALNKIIETVGKSIDPTMLPPSVMAQEAPSGSTDTSTVSGVKLIDF